MVIAGAIPGAMLAAALPLAGGQAAETEGAQTPAPFAFTPQPRWTEEPETGALCEAIRKECPGLMQDGEVSADVGYDELYDTRGMLAGMRLTRSTGCKPLDEDALLSRRQFRMAFHKEDVPDLDGIHAEVAPGTDPNAVRIVKASGTSLSIGCE